MIREKQKNGIQSGELNEEKVVSGKDAEQEWKQKAYLLEEENMDDGTEKQGRLERCYTTRCQLIFQNIKIQRVIKYPNFIKIDTYECIQSPPQIDDIQENISTFSSDLSQQFKQAVKGLKEKLPDFLSKIDPWSQDLEEQHILERCEGLGESKELLWYIPVRREGPKLASIIMSNELLREIGYDPNNKEEIMEMEKFKLFAFDLLNQNTYDTGFAFFNINLFAYIQKFLDKDPNAQQSFIKSQITSINQFRGKSEVQAKIVISAVSPYIISYRIVETIRIKKLDDPIKIAKRNKLIEKSRKKAERIIKIYEQNQRSKKPIVCSYLRIEKRGKRTGHKQKDDDYYQPSEKRGRN